MKNGIKDIFGDNTKAKTQLNWEYNKSFFDVLDILIAEEKSNYLKKYKHLKQYLLVLF